MAPMISKEIIWQVTFIESLYFTYM